MYVGIHCKLYLKGNHTFIGNRATDRGGAIHVRKEALLIGKAFTLTLQQNKANTGGGLSSFFSPINLHGKVFVQDNCANNDGGGVFVAGGSLTFQGLTIFDNNIEH